MPAKVDRGELRRRLVKGWRPRQHVEIRVEVLEQLLDELDRLEVQVEVLEQLLDELDRLEVQVAEGETTRASDSGGP